MSRAPARVPVTRAEYEDLLARVVALEKFNEDLIAMPDRPGTAVEKAESKRGKRLPLGWMPKDSTVDQIRSEFPWLTNDDFIREHRKFCDWAYSSSSSNAVKKDWEGTWRNWMRREFEKRPQVASRRAGLSTVDAKVADLQAGKR